MVVGDLKLSTSSQCIKYLMFVFNLLFVITGIILLSIGSVIHGVYYNYHYFLDNEFFSVPSLLIAVGSIIFFVAFFGCCGAIRENYCMVVTFAALMVVVFILELSAGISGYVLKSSATDVIRDNMKVTMKEYTKDADIATVWDQLQKDFGCCGAEKPEEWIGIWNEQEQKPWKDGKFLPVSCCNIEPQTVGEFKCIFNETKTMHTDGCLGAVSGFIQTHAVQLGSFGLGIAFLQVMGIWFSIYLARAIKRNYVNM